MNTQLTRAQIRDQVRRQLGQVPPVDDGSGSAGAQPNRWPWPSNASINIALDRAVAELNAECRIAGDPVPKQIQVGAQSANGPFQLNLMHIGPFGSAMEVRHASWASGGQPTYLNAASREKLDQNRIAWEQASPGTPYMYWTENNTLMISPAPSSAGTLGLMLGQSLWTYSVNADSEVPEGIINTWFPTVIDYTEMLICEELPEDVSVQASYMIVMGRLWGPTKQRGGVGGLVSRMKTFYQERNRNYQAAIQPKTQRLVPMLGRR